MILNYDELLEEEISKRLSDKKACELLFVVMCSRLYLPHRDMLVTISGLYLTLTVEHIKEQPVGINLWD